MMEQPPLPKSQKPKKKKTASSASSSSLIGSEKVIKKADDGQRQAARHGGRGVGQAEGMGYRAPAKEDPNTIDADEEEEAAAAAEEEARLNAECTMLRARLEQRMAAPPPPQQLRTSSSSPPPQLNMTFSYNDSSSCSTCEVEEVVTSVGVRNQLVLERAFHDPSIAALVASWQEEDRQQTMEYTMCNDEGYEGGNRK